MSYKKASVTAVLTDPRRRPKTVSIPDEVGAERRFVTDFPCPVCGGHADLPRGQGVRCWGFLGADGRFAHCTREELAGDIRPTGGGTYAHLLADPCKCGADHSQPRRS
jgi:hypothetical protein